MSMVFSFWVEMRTDQLQPILDKLSDYERRLILQLNEIMTERATDNEHILPSDEAKLLSGANLSMGSVQNMN